MLAHRFFEDIAAGEQPTHGLFINMNTMFEAVVERAFRDGANQLSPPLLVEGQADTSTLITGPHAVDMTPDLLVTDADGQPLLVGDAKWKTGTRSPSDVYQLTSYMLADGVPGLLVYPEQQGITEVSQVRSGEGELSLRSVELPTATATDTYETFCDELTNAAAGHIRRAAPLGASAPPLDAN